MAEDRLKKEFSLAGGKKNSITYEAGSLNPHMFGCSGGRQEVEEAVGGIWR